MHMLNFKDPDSSTLQCCMVFHFTSLSK